MSSLTTTTINTANGATDLTLTTGNTGGAAVVVSSGSTVFIRANSSANVFITNATAIVANAATTVSNTLTVANTLTAATIQTSNVNGNVTFSNTVNFASAINTTSIGLGTPSIATSGFSRLPNGLLMQWGTVSVNSTTGSITFPTAFAANPYSIVVTSTSGTSANAAGVTAVSTTTATVRSASTAAASSAYWMAIGV